MTLLLLYSNIFKAAKATRCIYSSLPVCNYLNLSWKDFEVENMTTSSQGGLRVFISHSSKDNSFCVRLVKNLSKIFGDEAIRYDKKGALDGSDSWWHQIVREIAECDIFIPILSPEAMDSIWIRNEFLLAKAQKKQVIPVFYRKCEVWQELKNIPTIQFYSSQTYDDDFEMLLNAIETMPLNTSDRQQGKPPALLNSTSIVPDTPTDLQPINPSPDTPQSPITIKLVAQKKMNTVPSTPAESIPVRSQSSHMKLNLPRIFVSHSTIDDAFNTRLVQDLRSVTGNNDVVWYNTVRSLQNGDARWLQIQKEISQRPVFIVILSPSAVTSKLVNDEIKMARSLKNSPEHCVRIIPLLYRQCAIPSELRMLNTISFLDLQAYDRSFTRLLRTLIQPT